VVTVYNLDRMSPAVLRALVRELELANFRAEQRADGLEEELKASQARERFLTGRLHKGCERVNCSGDQPMKAKRKSEAKQETPAKEPQSEESRDPLPAPDRDAEAQLRHQIGLTQRDLVNPNLPFNA
jgi:hypothetical protein